MLANLVFLITEHYLDLLYLSLFLAIRLLANFREGLQAVEIDYEVLKFFVEFLAILQDLLASLHELLTVKVFRQLSRNLLFGSILGILTIFLNQNYILQLFNVLVKLFELVDLLVQTLLKLLLDLLDLLLHLLLVVGNVNGLAEYLVLLLLMYLLQLL